MQTRVNFVWRCGFMRNTGSSFNSKPISRRYADSLPGAKVAATDSGNCLADPKTLDSLIHDTQESNDKNPLPANAKKDCHTVLRNLKA
ncbi:MAG: hypothetical protein KA131_15835, partial [Thauera sp.]|nr:hypothetical protein [Thauera sp.]